MEVGDTPDHKDVWAIILDADYEDVIWDGWHRFHCYIEKNISVIPAILPMFGEEV